MKSSIVKASVATAIVLITGTSAAFAGPAPRDESAANTSPPQQKTTMEKIGRGTAHLARTTWRDSRQVAATTVSDSKGFADATWDGSKKVARTVVHSPVIAYEVVRGERPVFPHQTAALTGHRAKSRTETNVPTHYDPPI